MRMPNYEIVEETEEWMLLRDLGPWDQFPTITNAAEEVVERLDPALHGRRLYYYDSEGERTELRVENGRFAGFAFAGDA